MLQQLNNNNQFLLSCHNILTTSLLEAACIQILTRDNSLFPRLSCSWPVVASIHWSGLHGHRTLKCYQRQQQSPGASGRKLFFGGKKFITDLWRHLGQWLELMIFSMAGDQLVFPLLLGLRSPCLMFDTIYWVSAGERKLFQAARKYFTLQQLIDWPALVVSWIQSPCSILPSNIWSGGRRVRLSTKY